MQIKPIKTATITQPQPLTEVLRAALPTVSERSVVCVTSKVVAICEGRLVAKDAAQPNLKKSLVAQEAEKYLSAEHSQYGLTITVRDQVVAINAGIDESNVDNAYVLLPSDSYASAKKVWEWLRQEYGVKEVGVLITDSKTIPLKWGTMGTCLGHCGFQAIEDKIGTPDLFGRNLQMTKVNVAEALAAACVLTMGEADESQPICIASEIPQITFQDHATTEVEIEALHIAMEDDAYAPLLTSVSWETGGRQA